MSLSSTTYGIMSIFKILSVVANQNTVAPSDGSTYDFLDRGANGGRLPC